MDISSLPSHQVYLRSTLLLHNSYHVTNMEVWKKVMIATSSKFLRLKNQDGSVTVKHFCQGNKLP
jgi:hypothetical protein